MSVIARLITESDINSVCKLQHTLFTSPFAWPMDVISLLCKGNSGVVAVNHNNQVVGFSLCSKRKSDIDGKIVNYITCVGVDAKYRNRGIAKVMLRMNLRFLRNEKRYLNVRVDNAPAIKSYTGVGFKIIATIPKYYIDVDGYCMEYTPTNPF